MVSKKRRVLIGALLTIFSFMSLQYLSCTKTGKSFHTCDGYVCENGGFCHADSPKFVPQCICPTGYEGNNCENASVTKFIGTWNMTQTLSGSDSTLTDSTVSHFSVFLTQTATPTTFFINNFSGNPYYNQITCTIDSVHSNKFYIDSLSTSHMLFDHYQLISGSGTISTNDSVITGGFIVRHLTATSNWVNDTVSLVMTLQ